VVASAAKLDFSVIPNASAKLGGIIHRDGHEVSGAMSEAARMDARSGVLAFC
jgi:hypothetical protein